MDADSGKSDALYCVNKWGVWGAIDEHVKVVHRRGLCYFNGVSCWAPAARPVGIPKTRFAHELIQQVKGAAGSTGLTCCNGLGH